MTRKNDEIEKIVNNLGFELLDQYIKKNGRRVIIQDKRGYKYNVQLSSLLKPNHMLSIVDSRHPNESLYNIDLWLKLEKKTFELCKSNKYTGAMGKIMFYCFYCNEVFYMNWNNISQGQNCPRCSFSKEEAIISKWLNHNNIYNVIEKRFDDCRDKCPLPFDFYLLDYKLCIEYQGEQHFSLVDFSGKDKKRAEKEFKKRQINDKIKEDYCKNNNINLLIIPYWEFDNIEQILKETLSQLEGSTA